jgi:hypothetical protein
MKLLSEMISDARISNSLHLEEKENWMPVYRFLARTYLIIGFTLGSLMCCIVSILIGLQVR